MSGRQASAALDPGDRLLREHHIHDQSDQLRKALVFRLAESRLDLAGVVQSIPGMRYHVGEKVGFRVQTPTQEEKHGPRNRGEHGPENCGIATVKALMEAENCYILSMSGKEHTAPEGDILGTVSWNAASGKWQIDRV